MSTVSIEINEAKLRQIVYEHLAEKLGTIDLKPEDVHIEVKSKQNYKAEWETAAFRATVTKSL